MKKKKDKKNNEIVFKTLYVEETKYKTIITKKFENRKVWQNPDSSIVYSIIPGTVSKVYVTDGDTINEGDKLLVLDAMKMKNTIRVPYSGVIKKVNVIEGQSIPKGFVMVELDIQLLNIDNKEVNS
ncbi:MAG: acetyl-CoA carboxylase biotin carboxyl carrier protein subunit [Bacteroidetes bacterium]|nr:acetyl-CoA carboxylase biotin carboxyl carrier protein subunit [Bacteroidota bacterium]PIX35515.1 MAG: acetyl-CoA carboxylase biotin carboxyl carrier protein subunit [Bacteroidetes bacterium CG_4_8_14_3_um_filter_31_14]